ncbi:MAG: hypothetical protein ACFCVH_22025, partial [Alphaproteobacteria bacterium]
TGYTASAFRARPFLFKAALARARDDVGLALARTWATLDPYGLTFDRAAMAVLDAADEQDPALTRRFEINFRWREIL